MRLDEDRRPGGTLEVRLAVNASLDERGVTLSVKNVSALTLELPPGTAPFRPDPDSGHDQRPASCKGAPLRSDRSWKMSLRWDEGQWRERARSRPSQLRKRRGLQGPIDDAFMDSFLFVTPVGQQPKQGRSTRWSTAEQEAGGRALAAPLPRRRAGQDATATVTEEDIRSSHLVLWGRPAVERLIERIADELPIKWTAEQTRGRRQAVRVPSITRRC